MKIKFDDYGFRKQFTLKLWKSSSWHRTTYCEVNLGWFWIRFWVKK